MKKYLLLIAGFFIWLVCFFIWDHLQANKLSFVALEPAVEVKSHPLEGISGPIDKNFFKGKWSLVLFGYTSCPDVCPTALITIKRELKFLRNSGRDLSNLQIVFIGVDPDRDDKERLQKFVAYFDKKIIIVTGAHKVLGEISKNFYTSYSRDEHQGHIDIHHTCRFYIVNPKG